MVGPGPASESIRMVEFVSNMAPPVPSVRPFRMCSVALRLPMATDNVFVAPAAPATVRLLIVSALGTPAVALSMKTVLEFALVINSAVCKMEGVWTDQFGGTSHLPSDELIQLLTCAWAA